MKQGKTHYTKRTRRSRTRRIGGAVLVFFALATVALVFAIYHAEPILRGRIMDTLSARFHSRVELPEFHVSVAHGLQVSGRGLKIFSKSDLNIHQPGIQPLITVDEFRFGAAILNFLRTPMRVHRVYLKGLELNIPPREQKDEGFDLKREKVKIHVDEFVCEQARLVINTLKPDKLPLEFDIGGAIRNGRCFPIEEWPAFFSAPAFSDTRNERGYDREVQSRRKSI